jgi:hypothetical protein
VFTPSRREGFSAAWHLLIKRQDLVREVLGLDEIVVRAKPQGAEGGGGGGGGGGWRRSD